jgi:ribokinase
MGVKNVVITLGIHGAYWTNGQEACHVSGIKVDAVDTTGAGDTFNGALATAIGEGFPVVTALQFANAAAAVSVTRHGAAVSCPARQEIEAMMHLHYGQNS